MTQILADANMTKQLQEATGPVAVVNDQGTMIGYCMPIKFPHSPYSREEITRRREEARANWCASLASSPGDQTPHGL